MKRTLVILAAIAATVAIVAMFAWAANPTLFDGDVQADTFIGALTGAVTGNVTGNVTGDLTGNPTQSAAFQGNLPTAADNTGEFFYTSAGETLFWADNDTWVQLAP